jgi:tetratricopeptide (TPR) repeat protein
MILVGAGLLAGAARADDLTTCRRAPADDAIAACSRLIAASGLGERDRARAFYNRANAYGTRGDRARSMADFDAAIGLDPDFAPALNDRGYAALIQGDLDRAIADFDAALRIDPGFANSYAHRGTAYLGKGDVDRAIADLDRAVRLNPRYAHGFSLRGDYHLKRGNYRNAKADYEAALALRPDLAAAQRGLSEATARLATAQQPTMVATAPSAPAMHVASAPAVPVAAAPATLPARRAALVIGNAAYPGAARLLNPGNDADDVAAALRRLGFEVIEGRDLTLAGFAAVIAQFRDKAVGADTALIYYAGHGMQLGQQNWLMPIDARVSSEFDARYSNVALPDLLAEIEARATTILVFIDACRENPLAEELRNRLAAERRSFGETRGLARFDVKAPQTLVVFATRPNMVAADGQGRNSPFTEAFLQHVATPGVEIEVLMKRVAASVVARTEGRQQPERLSRLEREFYFVPP